MSVELTHGLILDRYVGNIDWPQLTRTRFVWVRATAGRAEDRKWRAHVEAAAEHGLSVATLHEADRASSPEDQAAHYMPHLVGKTAVLRLDRGWDDGEDIDFSYADMVRWVDRYHQVLPAGITLRVLNLPFSLSGMLSSATAHGRQVGWYPGVNEPTEHAPTVNDLGMVVGVADRAKRAGTVLTHWLWAEGQTIRQASGPVGRVVRIKHQ